MRTDTTTGATPARRPPPFPLPIVGRSAFRRAVHGAAPDGTDRAVFVVHVERSHDVATRCGSGAHDALAGVVIARLAKHGAPWTSACRLGHERFALLKVGCDRAQALSLARRLHDAIDGIEYVWRGRDFRLGATVAVVEVEGRAHALDDILERAVRACTVGCALGSDGVIALTGRAGEEAALEREREWREHLNEVLG